MYNVHLPNESYWFVLTFQAKCLSINLSSLKNKNVLRSIYDLKNLIICDLKRLKNDLKSLKILCKNCWQAWSQDFPPQIQDCMDNYSCLLD